MNEANRSRVTPYALAAAFLLAAAVPLLVESRYYLHLAIMTCINIMLALSFSLMFSAGLKTIGAAGFCGIGAYASTLLVTLSGFSFWAALPMAGAVAALAALAVGAVIVRNPGVAFIVQTMVVNMIVVQILGHFEVFGSWGGILDIPAPALGSFRFATKGSFFYLALGLLAAHLVAFWALYTSRVGRAWRSIKLNPQLAEAAGVNLFRYRLLAFVIASASAGVAGSFYAHYFQTIEPNMFSVFKSIYVQIYSIVGGLGFYLLGPVVGAAVMTFVPELLRVSKEIEPILTGGVLVAIVIFLPGGLLSLPGRVASLGRAVMPRKAKKANLVGEEAA